VEALTYPKLKHLLGKKWTNLHSLSVDFRESHLHDGDQGRMLLQAAGRLEYRKLDGIYSFRRESRGVSQRGEGESARQTPVEMLLVYDGQHFYDQQAFPGRKLVYVHPPRSHTVRVATPCPMYFKFLEGHGIVGGCSQETLDGREHYLIGLEFVQKPDHPQSDAVPALEVYYHAADTGLLSVERYFSQDRREVGRCTYSNFRLNEDLASEPFQYVKPADVLACPLEEEPPAD